MGALKLYPALDLLGGACVRLAQGRFEDKTVYSTDPLEVAARFQLLGAQALHIVDLDGAKDPAKRQLGLLRELIAAVGDGLEVQVGGGIRSLQDARGLLDAGADRVVIGSLAVQQPEKTESILAALGADKITLALDLAIDDAGEARVAIKGWQESSTRTLEQVLTPYLKLGVRHLLCTDIRRDGMLTGPNLALYARLKNDYPGVEIQASGGIKDLDDLRALTQAGIPAAILGRSIYQGSLSLAEALASC